MALDEHEKPRGEREPQDYVWQIADSLCDSAIQLGIVTSHADFLDQFFNPVVAAVHQGGGGDALHTFLANQEQHPEGKLVDNKRAWINISIAYLVQALMAYERGEIAAAWTYVVDGRFAADAVLSDILDQLAISRSKKAGAIRGAAAKLANDPVQAAKPAAFELWQDWQAGRTLHKSGASFDRHVVEKLPAITSTKTVERWRSREWSKNRD